MEEKKDKNLIGNEEVVEAIHQMREDLSDETLAYVLTVLRKRMKQKGHLVVAVKVGDSNRMELRPVKTGDGKSWFATYTDFEEQLKGKDRIMSGYTAEIKQIFDITLLSDSIAGIIVNPWSESLQLDKNLIRLIKGDEGSKE